MKKFLAIVLAAVMALSMISFATAEGDAYQIKVWVAEAARDLTAKQIEDFNATNEFGFKFEATIEAVSEAVAADNMVTDVEAGADIFCFAQDQFARLVQAGALDPLGKKASEFVMTSNAAGTVAAAASGDQLYAYPLTADNGYFMYYDKSVIPEEDIDSLEKLIKDCEDAQKYFGFEMQTSAWYLASFFFAVGCDSEWTTDENARFIALDDDFDSPAGLIAVKGMEKLVKSPFHLSSSSVDDFNSGAAIVVSGTWAYNDALNILGDNMGVADLPSFEVDGKEYHLGSFNGCKLMGVKPQVDDVKGAAIHKLAQYLTGEKCQLERFETLAWGPSNLVAQASDAVQANPGLAALFAQSEYSQPQGQIMGEWWEIAKVIAEDVKAAEDEAGLQAALDNYATNITTALMSKLEAAADPASLAWTVIGAINGTAWDTDFEMEDKGDGKWVSVDAFQLAVGDEFKVRQGKDWAVNFPAENVKVTEAGTYRVVFDTNTKEVTLEAAQ